MSAHEILEAKIRLDTAQAAFNAAKDEWRKSTGWDYCYDVYERGGPIAAPLYLRALWDHCMDLEGECSSARRKLELAHDPFSAINPEED